MIRFPIIQSRKQLFVKIVFIMMLVSAGIGILYAVISFFIFGLYDDRIIGKYFLIFSMCTMIACVLVIVVYSLAIKGYIVLGEIIFSESEIEIKTKDIEKLVKTVDIKNCELKIKGFDGESPITRSAGTYKGNFNYITIETGNETLHFEFYILDFLRIRSLLNVIKGWREIGSQVALHYRDKTY